jgi:hypothetical protein
MADHDVEGQLQALLRVGLSPGWIDLWIDASCQIESFERLALDDNATDAEIWKACKEHGIVLITGNRNAEGELSLEQTIRRLGTSQSLPVLTISDPGRVMNDRRYAEDIAAQVLDYLRDLDKMRGAGRLFLP